MFHRAIQTTHTLLRVVAGFLFMCHGAQKLLGWFGGFGNVPGARAELFSLMGLAGTLETIGGLAVMLGLLTRPIAFLLAGEMAVAYFMVHRPNGTLPIENQGELAALYAFLFLFFAANGAGAFSLDSLLQRGRAGAWRHGGPVDEPPHVPHRA